MRGYLSARSGEIRAPDVLRTINMGLFIAGAACREALLARYLSVYPVSLTDDDLVDEISSAFRSHVSAHAHCGA